MKKLLHSVIEKWYWFLFGAAVLGEAAVFLFQLSGADFQSVSLPAGRRTQTTKDLLH